MTRARTGGIILVVAALALAITGTADAKKKKAAAKKHKTPAAKDVGSDAKEAPEPAESSDSGETKADQPKTAAPKADQGTEEAPPPAEEGDAKSAQKAKRAAAEEPTAEGGLVPPALEFVLGGGALFRNLAWSPANTAQLAPYSLAPGPEAHVSLEVYPAGFVSSGFAANIGIVGGFGYGFGVTSKTSNGTQLTTTLQDLLVGLKLRIPLGMLVPYVSVAYGAQSFRLDGQGAMTTVPATNYKFVRGGLGTRVRFSPAADLDVGAGYVYVTDPGSGAGEIASSAFFPKATAYAVDAGLSFGIRLISVLGLRAGVDFRQYGLAFNLKQGDAGLMYGTGGATDRYIVAWAGIEMTLDGLGGGANASEDEAKPAPASKKAKRRRQPEPEPDPSEDAPD